MMNNELILKNPYSYLKSIRRGELTKENVDFIADNTDFCFDLDLFEIHSILADNPKLLLRSFKKDPKIATNSDIITKLIKLDYNNILLINNNILSNNDVKLAISLGYVPKKIDLTFNPRLTYLNDIMEPLVESDPSLLAYVRCAISSVTFNNASKKYSITVNDIINNSHLIYYFKPLLPFKFRLCDNVFRVIPDRKKAIYLTLFNDKEINEDTLPFLNKAFAACSLDEANKLYDLLKLDYNEKDINVQEYFYHYLDLFIDSITRYRYGLDKKDSGFNSIVSLYNKLIRSFEIGNPNIFIDELTIYFDRVGISKKTNDYVSRILDLFNEYKNGEDITLSKTSDMFNNILNLYEFTFFSITKDKIKESIKSKLNLSLRVNEHFKNQYNLKRLSNIIRFKTFDKYNISYDEFINDIALAITRIRENKAFKYNIDKNDERILIEFFLQNGELSVLDINNILEITDQDACKYIVQQFNKVKLKYLELINDDKTINMFFDKKLNYTDYLIFDKKRYLDNLAAFIANLNGKDNFDFVRDANYFKKVAVLLLFVDLTDDFSSSKLSFLLTHINEIIGKLGNGSFDLNSFDKLLNNLDYLAETPDIFRVLLPFQAFFDNSTDDNRKTETINRRDTMIYNSLNGSIKKQVSDLSQKRLFNYYYYVTSKRLYGEIPPVSLDIGMHHFESGRYGNFLNLVFGSITPDTSCFNIGDETFENILRKQDGDVLIMYSPSGKPIDRLLLFRRGNSVILVPKDSSYLDSHPDVLVKIADEIIKNAKEANDNIDYVFSPFFYFKKSKFLEIKVNDFEQKPIGTLPHCDTSKCVVLLSSSNDVKTEEDILVDTKAPVKQIYLKERMSVSSDFNDALVNRLRALSLVSRDYDCDKKLDVLFYPSSASDYSKVYYGEDWFLGLKTNGELEECIIPSNDSRQEDEVSKYRKLLQNNVK